VVKIRQKNSREGQTSIDFLTGMTLFILTLVFAFQFMFGMVQPYTSTAEDSNRISDRVSDRGYTDVLSSSNSSPGEFSYSNLSDFFENTTESEVKEKLGLEDVNNFNITVSSGYTGYGTQEGLVAYWPMNERRSAEATDVANEPGERLNGEIQGNVTLDVRGISSSGAYRFRGPDAAVRVESDQSLNPAADTGNMTISAWVKPEGSQPPFATIVAKGFNDGYQMHLEGGEPVFEKGTGAEAQASKSLDNDKWYHLAGVYDSTASDRLKMYINGQLEAEDNDTIGNAPGDDLGIGKNLQNADPDDRFFNGVIDEVRIYERALGPNEITELYTTASKLSPSKADKSTNSPLTNTTYRLGKKAPSGQDIASVSTRKRVGYIEFGEDGSDDGGSGTGGGGSATQRVEFPISAGSPAIGDSLNEIEIEYPSSVNVSPLVQACKDSPGSGSPPCPGLVTVGIDGDGDGSIDPGRDATNDVECCPGSDGVMTGSDENILVIQVSGNYNIGQDDTIITQYPLADPDAQLACENAVVDVNNNNLDKSLNVCGEEDGGNSGGPDTSTVEITVRTW
jgi:hypothetical protein